MRLKHLMIVGFISCIILFSVVGFFFYSNYNPKTISQPNEIDEVDFLEYPSKTTIKNEYIQEVENDDGTITRMYYSTPQFIQEEGKWKELKKAKSLKNSFIECVVTKETELDPDVECVDYNYTSITLDIKDKIKDYEINIYGKDGKLKIKEDKRKLDIKTITYSWGDEIHIGENSTIIILNASDTQLMDDTFINSAFPTDNNGGETNLYLQKTTSITQNTLLRFDTSDLGTVDIIYSNLTMKLNTNGYDTGETLNVSIKRINQNYSWEELNSTWNNRPTLENGGLENVDYGSVILDWNTPEDSPYTFNTTLLLQGGYEGNVSIYLESMNDSFASFSTDYFLFFSKELGEIESNPTLIIVYNETTPPPAEDTCTYDVGNWNINCSDNCIINSSVAIDGDLILTGSGEVSLSANLSFQGTDQKIIIGSGCKFVINSGGKIK